jgi:hypothetical protein
MNKKTMALPLPLPNSSPYDVDLAQFEQEHGPFAPPANYRLEPEFINPAPRPIPSELYRGRHFRSLRRILACNFVIGVFCVLGSQIPFVNILALYFLPLQYLFWIGIILLSAFLVGFCRYMFVRGPLNYVREGLPLVVRILAIDQQLNAFFEGQPTRLEYAVTLQYRHPKYGHLAVKTVKHSLILLGNKGATLAYRVGDYATAVYLQSDPEVTFQLYGFLGLRPDLGIIARTDTKPLTLLGLSGIIAAACGVLLLLGLDIYAFGRLEPLEFSADQLLPFAIGAVVSGGVALGFFAWKRRKRRAIIDCNHNQVAGSDGVEKIPASEKSGFFGRGLLKSIGAVLGIALVGGLTFFCWALLLNAFYDTSPAKMQLVKIRNTWMITHGFIFREYSIEYQVIAPGDTEIRKFMTTPEHLDSLGDARVGNAHVHSGFFGWPWVETISRPPPKNPLQPN